MISIFKKLENNGNNYPAISSCNPYPFLLSSYKAEDIMKDPKDLIQKKD